MRSRAIQFSISALFVCAAFGQDRVFHFAHTATPDGFQQIANPIRTLTGMTQVSVDATAATLTVSGTQDQLTMAEWLFSALDKPAVGQPPAQHTASDYPVPGSADLIRVYYLAHSETPQSLQEMINVVRAIAEVSQSFVCTGPKAMTLRGTAGQISAAAYVIDALDQPAGQPTPHSATAAFPMPGLQDQVARVFFLAHAADTPQRLQTTVNLIRSVTDMQRVFPYNALQALTLRGTEAEMALAEWLYNELDKPSPQTNQHTATAEYHLPGANPNNVVRIFYLAHAEPPQGAQEMANLFRATADVQRAHPYIALEAISVRSSAAQVALAEWLWNTLDQPGQGSAPQEYQVAGATNDVARVFYLTHTVTPQAVQEMSVAVRSIANVPRIFPYAPPKALAIRGTPDQLALAAKVIQDRDQ